MADSYALTRTHSYRAGEKKRRACNINQVIFIILWYSVSGSGSAHGVGIHARPFAHRHFRNIHVFGLMRLDSFCFVLLASSSARRHLFRGPFLFVKAKKEKCETRETQSWKKKMWTRVVLVAKKKNDLQPDMVVRVVFFSFFSFLLHLPISSSSNHFPRTYLIRDDDILASLLSGLHARDTSRHNDVCARRARVDPFLFALKNVLFNSL